MHVFALAEELIALEHDCIVLVPGRPETVEAHGRHHFGLMTYDEALTIGLIFSNGAGPDFVHAWTPRDHVRRVVEPIIAAAGCPYLVHMEDHEEQIVADEVARLDFDTVRGLPQDAIAALIGVGHRSHPHHARAFIEGAVGYTCLIEPLAEFAARKQPALTFWPGFDAVFARQGADREAVRQSYDFGANETVILYSGNVHLSIVDDVAALYAAVALLRRRGHRVRLVRTGWDFADLPIGADERGAMDVLDLGFIPREQLPSLVDAADILVQPGRANTFNDYRFPSKLPEFLVSGRPVILPRSNIGAHLKNGREAIHLGASDAFDIAACVEQVLAMPDRGAAIGAAGRSFALKHLTWSGAANKLNDFYSKLSHRKDSRARFAQPASRPLQAAPQFPVDLIAFYLPQFHPIPENDFWWGKGFTEWTNVVRAEPHFAGHDQPRLPTELGFYDLRLAEVMHSQAVLAREYGVSGFCFYYYWFDGRRLLEKPLDLWLKKGPDFPFCVCWANEPWSRRWDGSSASVLMQQPYSEGFAEAFIMDVLPILQDARYIRVDGAPLLMIYKIIDLPDPIAAVATWRRIAREHGIDRLHIVAAQSFGLGDPTPFGLDAAAEFTPHHTDRSLIDPGRFGGTSPEFTGYLEDYVSVAMKSINAPEVDYIRYRGVFPRWDNSARRRSAGHVIVNDTTKAYANWLRHAAHAALVRREQQAPLIFINAWNEWAEGAYLEPDETYGRTLLEVTRAALGEGVIDYVRGRSPERDRAFNLIVSRVPKKNDHG